MNLPNKLTLSRVFMTPVMIVLFFCKLYLAAAVVFVLAALTDMLDGKIARKRNLVTTFGKFVDPLADKLINLAAIIILAGYICLERERWYGIFTVVTAVVIVSREVIITSLRALAANEGIVIAADKLGKLKTVIQDVAIVVMFLDAFFFGKAFLKASFAFDLLHYTGMVALFFALALTVLSGINYFVSNKEIVEKIRQDI